MKNIGAYVFITIVSLVLVVASTFLMTAADEPIRQAGMYLPLIFGALATWSASRAGLLEMDCEEHTAPTAAHAA